MNEIASGFVADRPRESDLAARILRLLREEGAMPGTLLRESTLARRLDLSRTPVRAALARLTERGVLAARAGGGFLLVRAPDDEQPTVPPTDPADWLTTRIARDRRAGALADEVSESQLAQRYGVARSLLRTVLARLAELDEVTRKPGYGWRFAPAREDLARREEAYRFRQMVEPAAILEPGFHAAPEWLAAMRRAHSEMLTRPWRDASAVAFFEMNAAFHEGLARASGNRFVVDAVRRHNALRRLRNYAWEYGEARVEASCREHLEIIARLESNDRELAAILMRRHLGQASATRSVTGEAR
jgi:DNA-binding GntR family transcriptional regulator